VINYMEGDATDPLTRQGEHPSPTIIAHIVNDAGGWGRGFVVSLSKMSRVPETAYRTWSKSCKLDGKTRLPLGSSQLVLLYSGMWVANMVAQHGWSYGDDGRPPTSGRNVGHGAADNRRGRARVRAGVRVRFTRKVLTD